MSEGATNSEAFPVLVRGFESETGLTRKNSITKEFAPAARPDFDESPGRGRPEVTSFSLSATEFLRFDKKKSIDSGDEDDDKTKQEDGFMPPAVKVMPTIVDRVLELQREHNVAPEDLLMMAVSEQETPVTGRRSSIWGKLGKKYRADDVYTMVGDRQAMDEWTRVESRFQELNLQKTKMTSEIESLKRGKSELTETNADLTDTINTISAHIKDVRKSRKAARDTFAKEAESQTQFHAHLLDARQTVTHETTEQLCAATESEERWRSRIEELREVLLVVEGDRALADQDLVEFRGLLSEIADGTAAHEEKQGQIEACLVLLGEAMDYFSRSQDHIEFNVRWYTDCVLRTAQRTEGRDARGDGGQ